MTLVRCEGTEFCDILLLINWISLVKAGLEHNVYGDHEVIRMYYIFAVLQETLMVFGETIQQEVYPPIKPDVNLNEGRYA